MCKKRKRRISISGFIFLQRVLCQISDRDERFPMIIGLHQRLKTLRDAKSSISRSVLSTKIRGGRLSKRGLFPRRCQTKNRRIRRICLSLPTILRQRKGSLLKVCLFMLTQGWKLLLSVSILISESSGSQNSFSLMFWPKLMSLLELESLSGGSFLFRMRNVQRCKIFMSPRQDSEPFLHISMCHVLVVQDHQKGLDYDEFILSKIRELDVTFVSMDDKNGATISLKLDP